MKKPTEIFNEAVERHMSETGRNSDCARHIVRISNSALWDAVEEQWLEEHRARLKNDAEGLDISRPGIVRLTNTRAGGEGRLIKLKEGSGL